MRANINLKFRGIESTLYYDDIPEEGEPNMYHGHIYIDAGAYSQSIQFSGKTIHEAVNSFEKVVSRWLDFGEVVENVSNGKY